MRLARLLVGAVIGRALGPRPFVGAAGIARAWALFFVTATAVAVVVHLVMGSHPGWLRLVASCALLALLLTGLGHQRATRPGRA